MAQHHHNARADKCQIAGNSGWIFSKQPVHGAQHVRSEREPADGVEHLWGIRLHARAETRGQNNDGGDGSVQDPIGIPISDSTRCGKGTGAAGFEPTNDGTKTRCLTAWLRPTASLPPGRRKYRSGPWAGQETTGSVRRALVGYFKDKTANPPAPASPDSRPTPSSWSRLRPTHDFPRPRTSWTPNRS